MHALALALALVASRHRHPKPPPDPRPYLVSHYDLVVSLDAKGGTFKTTTALVLTPSAPLSAVQLDARDLKITSAEAGGSAVPFAVAPGADQAPALTLTLPAPAPAGTPLRIKLVAEGQAQAGGHAGLVKSADPAKPDRAVYHAVFRDHGAPALFPCDDRPGDKATFTVTVLTGAGSQVLGSGARTADQKDASDATQHRVTWTSDKPLSPSELALAVGAFKTRAVTGTPVATTLQVAPDETDLVGPAQAATRAGMAYLTKFLHTPFPFSQFDVVAVPDLALPQISSAGQASLRASVLLPPADALGSHNVLNRTLDEALAHQWFGASVGPSTWDDAWLSDAVATYLARIAATDLSRNDSAFLDAAIQRRRWLFAYQDRPHTPALRKSGEAPGGDARAAATMKGAAVLRMLEKAVGRDTLRTALQGYLAAHATGQASAADLFSAVESASGKKLDDFEKAWIDAPGYPVIKLTPHWSEGAKQLVVTVAMRPNQGRTRTWPVPLTVVAHRTADPAYERTIPLTVTKSDNIGLPLPAEPEWIDWNKGDVALARIETSETVAALAAEAQDDPDPMARLWADLKLAGALADPDHKPQTAPADDAQQALANALRTDHSPYVRAALLSELARGTFKRLPITVGAAVLEQAAGPKGLTDDPAGAAELARAAYAALGRVSDPAAAGILTHALESAASPLDLVAGAALGLGHRGDPPSQAALQAALVKQGARGPAYLRAVLGGLAAVDDTSIVPTLTAQVQAHRASVELLVDLAEALRDNRTLLHSADGSRFVAHLADDAALSPEVRVRWIDLLPLTHAKDAHAELTHLSKDPDLRVAAAAKQALGSR